MKKLTVAVLMIALSCILASAESSVWKVQKGASVVYVGGTCHLLRESDRPLPPEFDFAYKTSDIVVFETDVGKLQGLATQQKLMAKATYSDGSTVASHLSADTFAALRAYCVSNRVPLGLLEKFKPAMLMTSITVLELMKCGVTQEGVDTTYYRRATEDKKTVKGLETIDEQIDFMVTMADGDEDEFVTYSLKDMKNIKEQFDELVGAWRRGDSGKLSELMVAELKTRMPRLYRKLISDRNANWLPMIEAYQKTPEVEFVLVGVAHLVGPDSVLEALKKKGCKVEKL